jgi:predicted kinase
MSKTFIIMSGVSGSGKSTIIGKLFEFFGKNGQGMWRRNIAFLSPDQNVPRFEESGKRDYNSFTLRNAWGRAWRDAGRSILNGIPMIIFDATFTTSISRSPAIHVAKGAGYHVIVIHFKVPVEICQERNQERFDLIPGDVISRQAECFQDPELEEGIDTIYRINEAGQVSSHTGRPHDLDMFFQSL